MSRKKYWMEETVCGKMAQVRLGMTVICLTSGPNEVAFVGDAWRQIGKGVV